ncbi:hypothetical protein P689_122249 [Candidatus Riesia pediculischaeffi PTSU]|uniref:Uncharacterized protein n=1 Tax=Candidatus Riesia pediculischaeffi PTSU TaxID=1401651 RepID=A0A0C1RZP8_9ENTR|nr:hypothetical protein P689_122249 [Candidatus Riesia pediculischaeffi PTSU]
MLISLSLILISCSLHDRGDMLLDEIFRKHFLFLIRGYQYFLGSFK